MSTLHDRPPVTAPRPAEAGLTCERVWRELTRASFAVIGYVTPAGAPRSSGVVYAVIDRRMYVVTAIDSWKARHITASGQVSVTVPVRRGGIMSLLMPIPPATISFHARAQTYMAHTLVGSPLAAKLGPLIPTERLAFSLVIEIIPQGEFVTYGVGVPLMRMRHPALARGRAKVA